MTIDDFPFNDIFASIDEDDKEVKEVSLVEKIVEFVREKIKKEGRKEREIEGEVGEILNVYTELGMIESNVCTLTVTGTGGERWSGSIELMLMNDDWSSNRVFLCRIEDKND